MISAATEQAYNSIVARLRSYGVKGAVIRHQVAQEILFSAKQTAGDTPLEIEIGRIFKKQRRRILAALMDEMNLPQNRQGESLAVLALEELDAGLIWLASFRADATFKAEVAAQGVIEPIITGPKLARSTFGSPTIKFRALQDKTNKTLAVLNRWPSAKHGVLLLITAILILLVILIAR